MTRRWHASHLFSVHQRVRKIPCHQWAAMAHRWQYKYDITVPVVSKVEQLLRKVVQVFQKVVQVFGRVVQVLGKVVQVFRKVVQLFGKVVKNLYHFSKKLHHFPKKLYHFSKNFYHLLENLYHISQKLFHFWQKWYQLYHICTVTYGPWLPIYDMKFFALAGERKRGQMHVTYTGHGNDGS